MKSERWQSSKSILLSFQDYKDELKTERQWEKQDIFRCPRTVARNSVPLDFLLAR